jgi:hypothetical protein
MEINISPFLAKFLLKFIPYKLSNSVLVMCLGYGEDYKNFTELVWQDDKDLDFCDEDSYPRFQLWIL